MSMELRPTPTILSQLHAFAELFGEAFTRAFVWHERTQQRQALQRLDDRMLRDIGLSRSDVEYEADKPFWRS